MHKPWIELKRIIDNIASWLVALKERKEKVHQDTDTFMKRGKNGLVVGIVIFGTFFTFFAYSLYKDYGEWWLSLVPMAVFAVVVFGGSISKAYKEKLRDRYRSTPMKLVGFNMDFNERVLKRIYTSLIRYEFLDVNLTSFGDFYNVLMFDFDGHGSVMHFNCTQAQLKYILEKFKPYKKGVHLSTFERSEKIYNKGEPISAEKLSKSYHKNPPTSEFENLIDSFFDFLGDN